AHDGIVNRVQRGPNEDHGGLYVRIAHRNGTVFTQYFHLAAIPRWMVVGKPIKAGDVVGLLGDSGVKQSAPHLHFTVSVKPDPAGSSTSPPSRSSRSGRCAFPTKKVAGFRSPRRRAACMARRVGAGPSTRRSRRPPPW